MIGDGGRASLKEVLALIEDGERLSVSVPKELSVSNGFLRDCKEWYSFFTQG